MRTKRVSKTAALTVSARQNAVRTGRATVDRSEALAAEVPVANAEGVVKRWQVRRRESAEALASLGLQAMHAQSPGQMVEVWMTWSRGALDRMVADANDHLALGRLVSQKLTTNRTGFGAGLPRRSDPAAERLSGETNTAA